MILRLLGYPYRFADLMLEGSFLLGLLGGRVVGPLGGAMVSLPAFLHHEWLSTPDGRVCRLGGRVDPSGDSEQGRHLGFRALHVSQRSLVRCGDLCDAAPPCGTCFRSRVAWGSNSAG